MKSYKSIWTIGFGVFFVFIGSLILLDNLNILSFRTVWSFFWPFLLIFVGVILVLSKRGIRHAIESDEQKEVKNDNIDEPEKNTETGREEESPESTERTTVINDDQQSHYFGNINYSSSNKDFEGLNISNIFGDIFIDISKVDFEGKEKKVYISGIFGSIKIKLPKDIPAKFIGSAIAGSVKFMDKDKEGLLVSLNSETLDFENSNKRLLIRTSIIFGEISAE